MDFDVNECDLQRIAHQLLQISIAKPFKMSILIKIQQIQVNMQFFMNPF